MQGNYVANVPWLAGHVTVAVFPGGNVGFSGSTTGFPRQSVAMEQPSYVMSGFGVTSGRLGTRGL